ncbi:hypothetical protein [Cognaticolwellia beringensis]|uniref:Uncharacterized protein n=1 Tax=Cognaticolwellia beringensis TaxID=1967665 RepID=A0A222G4D1_9GAMM|nr:hypothetical protein [Cognaticolwellia beringensis]ASP46767.1 hypothetical protein B5D82_02605 [Cognaticolwellia beringensis]
MIFSLFKKAKQADQCEADLKLLQKLDKSQSHRAKVRSLALITSPKGLAAIFTIGVARGFIKPSIARQLKSMAIVFGKTTIDDWLTGDVTQVSE